MFGWEHLGRGWKPGLRTAMGGHFCDNEAGGLGLYIVQGNQQPNTSETALQSLAGFRSYCFHFPTPSLPRIARLSSCFRMVLIASLPHHHHDQSSDVRAGCTAMKLFAAAYIPLRCPLSSPRSHSLSLSLSLSLTHSLTHSLILTPSTHTNPRSRAHSLSSALPNGAPPEIERIGR